MRASCHHLWSFTKMGIQTYDWEMKERKSKSSVGRGERKGKGEGVVGSRTMSHGRATN